MPSICSRYGYFRNLGCAAAFGLLRFGGWIGPRAAEWQFVLGIGMACAVTALPIFILFTEELQILRQPIGQRDLALCEP